MILSIMSPNPVEKEVKYQKVAGYKPESSKAEEGRKFFNFGF